jgi:hypothetical protein
MSSGTGLPYGYSTSNNRASKKSRRLPVSIELLKEKQSNKEIVLTHSPNSLILSAHQPTLLPYPGFFFRMYHSNIMDICPYDQFCRHSDRYQCRVKIGTDSNWKWLTLPVEASGTCSIMDVKLKSHFLNERWVILEKVYSKYPLWSDYKDDLRTIFFDYNYLWALNLRLIFWIRDLLKIKTYISISYKGTGSDVTERIASQFVDYGPVVYLAGKGSVEYLNVKKYEQLTNSTVALVTYEPPVPFSTVSILTPLLMYPANKVLEMLKIVDEPLKVIINGFETNIFRDKQNSCV